MIQTSVSGYNHIYSGKVRDLYVADDDPHRVLLVATDRVSAADHVFETEIPDKGRVLTALSLWWFDQLADLVPNHVLSTDVPDAVEGRAVVVERLTMVPIECVARGYLTGSGLVDYRRTGEVCGVPLPDGLVDGSKLPQPIFTPATKAELGGHDENIDFSHVEKHVGAHVATEIRDLTLEVYRRGEAITRERGIVLADTKIEVGHRADETLVLADEVLTPDSSRFWPRDQWEPGHRQPSFDKQPIRDWLSSPTSGWDGTSTPPPLPDDIVRQTRERYIEAYERITGEVFKHRQA